MYPKFHVCLIFLWPKELRERRNKSSLMVLFSVLGNIRNLIVGWDVVLEVWDMVCNSFLNLWIMTIVMSLVKTTNLTSLFLSPPPPDAYWTHPICIFIASLTFFRCVVLYYIVGFRIVLKGGVKWERNVPAFIKNVLTWGGYSATVMKH